MRSGIVCSPTDCRASGLKVEQLCKRFGGVEVFKGIDFELPPGGVLGVIGPNGAGKTTLINVVCGMLAPTSGRVLLNGVDVTGLPLHALSQRGVVRSFQQTNAFRSETVRENLLRAVTFSGSGSEVLPEDFAVLAEFGLCDFLDERSDKLPYGAQKMLGLLMAYFARPTVLLLDEPAAGLERSERSRVDRLVQLALQRSGCSVLVVEHDMDLIKRLCPTAIVLDGGRILATGAPSDVLARRDVIDAYVGSAVEG